jgi:hypothetical protein
VPFANLLPEKAYPEFGGHNTADVFFGVTALQPEELLCLSRTHQIFFFLHVSKIYILRRLCNRYTIAVKK